MSDTEPIVPLRSWKSGATTETKNARHPSARGLGPISFDRRELDLILRLYGSKVAEGEWRDYAIDFGAERAVFAVFRRSSETPLFRIEKQPKLARRQGAYAVVSQGGMILRRGHDLAQVLKVLMRGPRLIAV